MAKDKKLITDEQFNEIYAHHRDEIFAFCMAKLHCNVDDCEDCVQETFSVLLNKLRSGTEIINPRAFLYKTAFNFIKKSQAKASRSTKMETALDDTISQNKSNLDEGIITQQMLERMDKLLSQHEKQLFDMRYNLDMSIKDIAQALDISPSSCATQLSRLRSRLRVELKDFL